MVSINKMSDIRYEYKPVIFPAKKNKSSLWKSTRKTIWTKVTLRLA